MDRAPNQPSHKVDETRPARSRFPSRGKAWLIGALGLALLAWGGTWLAHRWTHVYVDDARIDGEVVTIASRVSGWVTDFSVIEGDEVKAGQPIARIDERDSVLHRDALLARLKAVESQMAMIRAQTEPA